MTKINALDGDPKPAPDEDEADLPLAEAPEDIGVTFDDGSTFSDGVGFG
ncbi:hypothetical protein HFO65_22260 [Rhizobium laguerreae]|nr:hypothetical protein [Rhizobium laguerreae]MBY3163344.1 hypothetical protein [Rhizobium laguerreae]